MSNDTALLIIDVQMGMFDEDEPVHNGDKLLQTLSQLIEKARQADVPVVYIQHNDSQFVEGNADWPNWRGSNFNGKSQMSKLFFWRKNGKRL